MTCAEFEILLCDYVDGTLRGAEKTVFESHLAGCSECAALAKEVAGVTAFIQTAQIVAPPPELLTRILHQRPTGREKGAERRTGWWRKWFGGWLEGILQPRYAMGMAMTVLSFAMVAKFAHIERRQLTPADLDPVKLWTVMDDSAHRSWDRVMKYYDNLRLVIEVQSRLKEWTEQDPNPAADSKQKDNSAVGKTEAGSNK